MSDSEPEVETAEEQVYAAIAGIKARDPVEGEMVTHGVVIYAYVGDDDEDGDAVYGMRLLASMMPDWMIKGLVREGLELIRDVQNERENDD